MEPVYNILSKQKEVIFFNAKQLQKAQRRKERANSRKAILLKKYLRYRKSLGKK